MKKFLQFSQTLFDQVNNALDLPYEPYAPGHRDGRRRIFNFRMSFLAFSGILTLIVFLLLQAFIPNVLMGQTPTVSWAKSVGSSGTERGLTLVEDNQGNILVAGEFQGVVDFDPGAAVVELMAITTCPYIKKMSADGDLIWVKNIEASTGGTFSIDVDDDDNVYLAGSFTQTGDFDPGLGTAVLSSNGQRDAFILKLDQTGAFEWVKQIGGTQNDDLNTLALDDEANIFVTGRFDSLVDFDPGTGTHEVLADGSSDGYVLNLDSDGQFKWVSQIKGLGSSMFTNQSLALDSEKNILLTGSFFETADFDPGAGEMNVTSNGNRDVFILKLNQTGGLDWVRTLGGSASDHTQSIAVDEDDNVYAYGSFASTVDFDPTSGTDLLSPTSGATDAFVIKLNKYGDYEFAKVLNAEGVTNLVADENQNLYLAGSYIGSTDFDPGAGVHNVGSTFQSWDAFVLKLNQNGEFVWVANASGEGTDIVQDILVTQDGGVLTTGSIELDADFDPDITQTLSLNSNGGSDTFYWKLGESIATHVQKEASEQEWSLYPSYVTPGQSFTLESKVGISDFSIQILSRSGQEVNSALAFDRNIIQLTSPQCAGLYLVRIITGAGDVNTMKLVVQ